MVTHPPLPRPGFWSLSAVWAAWLWGKQHTQGDHLRPLLSRKRSNWDWQWRAIGSALNVLQPALRNDARTVMSFPADEATLESVLLAGADANQVVEHFVCDPHDGVRVTWRPHPPTPSPQKLGEGEARRILLERAEPTSTLMLKAGLLAAWGQTSTLSAIAHQADGEVPPLAVLRGTVKSALKDLVEIEPQVWWLADQPTDRALRNLAPLADRVEPAVVELLRAQADWHTIDLLREVYRRFPDQLTPDRAVLATTIHSYAEESSFDQLHLRAEDHAVARTAEVQEVRQRLVEMGQRLGFETTINEQGVAWLKSYTFVIQTTAEIAALLRADTGVLVIPGGRATLLQYKLARDARLRDTHWQLLKFSSLRQAAQSADLTLQTFQLAFGLKSPIEQPATQIQLL
jgi:hypothetical protein